MRLRSTLLLVIVGHFAQAQAFKNLDFEETCDTCKTGLSHWNIAWRSAGARCVGDGPTGQRSLLIQNAEATDVGFVEQAVALADTGALRIITVSMNIRSEAIAGGRGAGIYITGLGPEGDIRLTKDMGFGSYKWVLGTHANKHLELRALCPPGVATVKLGLILYGSGSIWFDDVVVDLAGIAERRSGEAGMAYVDAACDTIRRHSLRRDSVDLDDARRTAYRIAGDANDPRDHYLAVEYLLGTLEDHHSFLMEPEVVQAFDGDGEETTVIEQPTHRIIEGCGYIAVPQFPSRDSLLVRAFADSIQLALEAMDAEGVRGWIVDLRNNTGGNMAPMVCGLGPLLDTGVLGQLVDVNGEVQRWWYTDGSYGWDDEEEVHVSRAVVLKRPRPVAVLISERTGSSGESTTISFVGNSRTRLFGQPTWGLTTGNGEFELPDGAKLFLASTIMADRQGNLMHGRIPPDEAVDQPADWTYDAALDAALKWIATRP